MNKKLLAKIIEYGIYFLAFLLPIQTRLILRAGEINNGYSEYLTISLYGVDILLIIILLLNCYVVFKNNKFKEPKKISTIWLILAGLELSIFVSIFVAEDSLLALYRYGVFLLGVSLFWLISSVNYKKIKLIWSFVFGLILQSVLALWQFFTQSSFASKWLGLARHNPAELGTSVIELASGERFLRAYGGFDHPNVLGGVIAITLLLFFVLIFKETRSKFQDTNKFKIANYKFLILLFTIYYLLFTAMLFSFSRSAWLGLIGGFLILIFFYFISKNYFNFKKLGKIIFLSLVFVLIIFSFYPELFQTRIFGQTRLENKSNQERIDYLIESKDIIYNNLFFGTGIGNYTLVLRDNYPDREAWQYKAVHNTFLLILSELGIFGFVFFLFLIFYLLKKSLDNKNYINLAIIFSILIMMSFDHWWWSLHFGCLFFWFIIGLIYKNKKNYE